MNSNKIAEGFLNKNIITFMGEICADTVRDVKEGLAKLYFKGSPEIIILITSQGGSVNCGLDIIDLLTLYKGKKTAIVCGRAYSTAAVILQACDVRYATVHSLILFHNLRRRMSLDVLRDEKKLREEIVEMEKLQGRFYSIVVKKTGKTLEKIYAEFAKDKNMDAEDALVNGYLDGIWDKPLPG